VPEDARLATILLVEIRVSGPEKLACLGIARVFAMIQSGMHVKSVSIFIIQR
jgi:hypothetical protein